MRLGVACAILLIASNARAQNADPFFYGDDAALAGGAVVASGHDSGALWYNPAGFGGLQRGMISANASTFGLRFRTIPHALTVSSGGRVRGQTELSSTDVISVPNAVVLATALSPRVALAGGLLVTQRDVRSALASVPESTGPDDKGQTVVLNERLDLQRDSAKYHAGGVVAFDLYSNLRLGAGLFATYGKDNVNVQYALSARGLTANDEHGFLTSNARVSVSTVGLVGIAGVQWDASSSVTLGLTIRTPEIALRTSAEGGAVSGVASAGGADPPQVASTVDPVPTPDTAGAIVAPGRMLAGVAFAIDQAHKSFLELGADFAHAIPQTSAALAQHAALNGRAGIRYMLSPGWVVGGGVFSDRATVKDLGTAIAADKLDWYGFTVGVSKRTPLSLVENPSPEALVLVTTFSLRAAAGTGVARTLAIDLDELNAIRADEEGILFYEVMPYLGSSVLF